MLPQELWKPIPEYEGYYEVSSYGNVRNVRTGRVLKPLNNHGYKRVNLSKGNVQKLYQVHRLVAFAFIPNPEGLPQINHKDENPNNNCVENLEWCTPLYNVRYGTGVIRQSMKRKGVPLTEERKKKISQSCKGRKPPIHTLEGRKKMSEAARMHWQKVRASHDS